MCVINKLKNNKSTGEDQIAAQWFKYGEEDSSK